MQRSIIVLAVCGLLSATASPASSRERWSAEQAWAWYQQQPWLVGFNYVPSYAANTTDWWQAETFDAATMDRELGWAQDLGFNLTRVFLQYIVWKQDPEAFQKRFDTFLALADKHGLRVMPVLFDDCSFGDPLQLDPFLGAQREPIPGMVLPSWTPSPGRKLAADPAERPLLQRYVQEVVGRFGRDPRVAVWDLFNEPRNVADTGTPELLRSSFGWARESAPQQPLTVGIWSGHADVNEVLLAESDVISYHRYGNYTSQHGAIVAHKAHGRPVICTEWMARPTGSRWDTDLPLFKAEAVGCLCWGLVNGRTQTQFSWASPRGAPEPTVWFHDLFHRDGRVYDPSEIAAIRQTTADKQINWKAADYRAVQTSASPAPRMLFGDATRHGRPFAKDPCVIKLGGRYLLYYSMAPSTDQAVPQGWAIGIAESRDLVAWTKVGEILPEQECERNGLVNGKALLLDGQVHLFYNSYGNGKLDALCHAVSDDGLRFRRDPTNPILRAAGDWNSGRAIDCEAFEHDGKLWLLFATRDPEMKTQMLVAATAPRTSDFGRAAWTQLGDGPALRPELPWETKCIEAPSVIKRGDTLYMFYGGGYNNDPQQVGCATSTDGLHWTRLFRQPLLPNGQPGDWNASETGHPGVFQDDDGRTYLFVQGNRDRGKTWFLSCVELGWQAGRPRVMWDSPKFPTPRPGPSAHHENGVDFSAGWTYWAGPDPPGGGLHYHHQAGGTATFSWEGTCLALLHKTGPDCGIASVLIDGQPATPVEVDTYAKTVDWQHRTVLASGLPAGQHTAVIEVTGRHHPEASDAYVQVVGFDTAAPPVNR